ncbi:MAG: DUF4369 domain-containing protein [Bacteroidota bacterium]
MLRIVGFVIVLCSICCCTVSGQNNEGFTIDGHFKGLQDGEKITLSYGEGFVMAKIQETTSKNENFHLSGTLPDAPRLLWVSIDRGESKKVVPVFLDNNEHMRIEGGDMDKMPNGKLEDISSFVVVEGSPTNHEYEVVRASHATYWGIANALKKDMDKLGITGCENLTAAEVTMQNRKRFEDIFFTILSDHPRAAMYVIDVFNRPFVDHAAMLATVYRNLSDKDKQSHFGVRMKEKVPLCVAQAFPAFTLPSVDGKMVNAKDVFSKNKLTLVQFFASNSDATTLFDAQKELQNIYKTYHDKGFDVIGICSDVSDKKWKLSASDLPGYQVSDLKGADGVVGKTYHEYGNPASPKVTNVLVDQNGNIVAWAVSGAELYWYLRKTFQ